MKANHEQVNTLELCKSLEVTRSFLARKGWWSREYVFVCSQGGAGGLMSTCSCAREEGLLVYSEHTNTYLRDYQPFLVSTQTSCAGMVTRMFMNAVDYLMRTRAS